MGPALEPPDLREDGQAQARRGLEARMLAYSSLASSTSYSSAAILPQHGFSSLQRGSSCIDHRRLEHATTAHRRDDQRIRTDGPSRRHARTSLVTDTCETGCKCIATQDVKCTRVMCAVAFEHMRDGVQWSSGCTVLSHKICRIFGAPLVCWEYLSALCMPFEGQTLDSDATSLDSFALRP